MCDKFHRAIERNLDDLQRAKLIWTSILGIRQAGDIQFIFLKLAYNSFINDYVAKCIRVFDTGRQQASFWYLHRSRSDLVERYSKEVGIDLGELDTLAKKLKTIRDKVLFHRDKDYVDTPETPWEMASISETELYNAIIKVESLLIKLRDYCNLPQIQYPNYSAIIPYRISKQINTGRW